MFFTFLKLDKWYQIAQRITFKGLYPASNLVTPYRSIRFNYWSYDTNTVCPYSVRMRENTDQKLLRIWTLSGILLHLTIYYWLIRWNTQIFKILFAKCQKTKIFLMHIEGIKRGFQNIFWGFAKLLLRNLESFIVLLRAKGVVLFYCYLSWVRYSHILVNHKYHIQISLLIWSK